MRQTTGLVVAGACALLLSTAQVRALPPDSVFEVAMVPISASRWSAIRYNSNTGEAWTALDGGWVKIEDDASIPKGRYVIKLTGLADDWAAIRLEVMTGATWQCRQSKWVEITISTNASPTPAAVTVSPASPATNKE